MRKNTKKFLSVLLGVFVGTSVCAAFTGCGSTNVDPEIPLDVDMNNKPQLELLMQTAGLSEDEFNSELTDGLIRRR